MAKLEDANEGLEDTQEIVASRFQLRRDEDVTGVSGTGTVADGVLWPDGTVSMRWRGARPSIVFWSSILDAMDVHGHDGRTRFVYLD